MNRRGFLGLFAGAVAGATLDPERALWIPGAKTISIPKPQHVIVSRYLVDGVVHPMSVSDYQALFVDVMDRVYYGAYVSAPKKADQRIRKVMGKLLCK